MNPTPLTLHLGLFFDGTGLNLHNQELGTSRAAPVGSYATGISNVALLYRLYPKQATQRLPGGDARVCLSLYTEGIGTRNGEEDSGLAQATGRYGSGVLALVEQVPGRVAALYETFVRHNPGRTLHAVEIDLFGFSRGAAAARHLANDLAPLAELFAGASLTLNFIGLFDTVAGMLAPMKGNFSAGNDNYDGLRLGLRDGLARKVMQLVAADEYRANFPLVASNNDIVVPGVHTDIGGGYRAEEQEDLVLERPFSSVESRLVPDARSQAAIQAGKRLEQRRAYWEGLGLQLSLELQSTELPFLPKRDVQREKQVRAVIRGKRRVRGELSRVYLRMMHAWAVGSGVPLQPVSDGEGLLLPEELHTIAVKLLAHACNLNEHETDLLRRRYIHLSAHWNAQLEPSSPLLDFLLIHRPDASGQRVIHPNR